MRLSVPWASDDEIKTIRFLSYLPKTWSALIMGFPRSGFPLLFKEAAAAAYSLQPPYLLIDSLCFLQDNLRNFKVKAVLMCEVYSLRYWIYLWRTHALNTCVLRQVLLALSSRHILHRWLQLYSKFRIAPCTHYFVSQTQPAASCCTAAAAIYLSLSPPQSLHKLRTPSCEVRVHSRRSSFLMRPNNEVRSPLPHYAFELPWGKGGCGTRMVGPNSCCAFVSTLTPNLKESASVSSSVPNRYERVSQTSCRSPLTRNAMNPLCVMRTILLYTFESSFKRRLTFSARIVAASTLCGGWSHSSGDCERLRYGNFADISAREMPLLQMALWASRRSELS